MGITIIHIIRVIAHTHTTAHTAHLILTHQLTTPIHLTATLLHIIHILISISIRHLAMTIIIPIQAQAQFIIIRLE